ncbi:hypothetical protein L6164_025309 [Bauhinia variegata]|uniref:Uncharacterized protein n=1 Tax=Bauhinia variegata TaxID=167791 RepID=A0ACB9M090_BAUVA|nr:hypothetical protein L6164_025309 [Bauhinia variegata]
MSTPVLAITAMSKISISASSDVARRSADYHPTIWGDQFIAYAADSTTEVDDKMKQQAQTLKEQVRSMLVSAIHDNLTRELNLIDSIQRLGVSYHFEHEIDEALQKIHNNYCTQNDIITHDGNLYSSALLFRLLRQHGYHISSDIFKKFKDSEGKFDQKHSNDVEGMLSLYEAAHYRVHGEELLDEALDFTSSHLKSLTAKISPSLAAQVNHSLNRPLCKGLPRIEARYYISFYEEDPSHDETLLLFAKIDFNIVQKLHQKEVGDISKWWKDLEISAKLSFARNRVVECCLWIIGVYFEPQYSLARRITYKVIALTSLIDDIYDAYGTMEELELLTNTIERWDSGCSDHLPEYMKIFYKAYLEVYEEIEKEITTEGRVYCVNYAKDAMKKVVQAQFTEAKWFHRKYIPTIEEYMSIASLSSGYSMLATTSFIGMGNTATEEIFKWIKDDPKIMNAAAVICRLMDDIVSNEFEQKRGHVVSLLECYMKEHDISREDTINELRKQVVNAWKDINEECLRPTQVPMPFLMRIVNFARVIDVFYKDEDCYTNAGGAMKTYIAAVFVEPVPI